MKTARLALFVLPLLVLTLGLASVGLGASWMPLDRVLKAVARIGARPDMLIIWNMRMPRMLLAVLAGAALAVAGALMQRVTRNPLAAPSVIGVEQGAALGILIFLLVFSNESHALMVSIYWRPVAAVLGGAGICALVGALVMAERGSATRLLLYGVALSALAQALVIIIMISGPVYHTSQAVKWLAGTVAQAEWLDVRILGWALVPLFLLLVPIARDIDQLRLDETTAAGTGLGILRARVIVVTLSVLLSAIAVSVVGAIGFIGLIAPHAARLLVGSRIGVWLWTSAFLGAGMVLSADLVVRLAFAPLEVPAGALTALFGAPYFLYLLVKGARVHA